MSSVRFSGVVAALLMGILLVGATAVAAGDRSYDVSDRQPAGVLVGLGSGRPPVRLYVEEAGRGLPLVLIHGLGGSSYSWRRLIPALSRTHRVFAIDMKGFGRSEKPFDLDYGPDEQAKLIAQFLRQKRLIGATIVGHSYGGLVALELARQLQRTNQGRIQKLILMNAPAYAQSVPIKQAFLTLPVVPYVALIAIPPIFTARAGLSSSYLGLEHVTDKDVGKYADPLHEAGGRHALIATMRRVSELIDRGEVATYTNLRVPTLLIWCRHDSVVPLSTGKRLVSELPHARLDIIERCDHTPIEETPTETLKLMQHFLAN
jgi:pimeloyl-ACP methyl ester carboxylesterase